jgi:hypothetical protein
MTRYFTSIAENEFNREWVQNPRAYSLTPFTSFQDFGMDLSNILILPCKLAFLTVTSLIESVGYFAYGFYNYCRSVNNMDRQDITDGLHCGHVGLKTLGLFLASLLYLLVFLMRLCSTLFKWISNDRSGYIPITNTRSTQRIEQNDEAISRALEEYTEFFRKVGIDKDTIEAVLVEHDSAVTACENLVATEREKLRQFSATVPGITHFQNTKRSITKSRSSRYSELFQEYKELFKTYPILGLQGWISGEEKWELTVEMVEQAQANCEEHHAKFLAVAEELLHESGILNQKLEKIFSEFKELKKQISEMRS